MTTFKEYEVQTTLTKTGFYFVNAESAAEAAFLIRNGYGTYEDDSLTYDIAYDIEDIYDEETRERGYDQDDYKKFEDSYDQGRVFFMKQGQLDLNDGGPTQKEIHEFAMNFARKEMRQCLK